MDSDTLVLCLGSNLGNREEWLSKALTMLEEAFGPVLKKTQAVQTRAIGFAGPPFLNMIALFRCHSEPLEVLAVCKDIERRLGRGDAPEYDGRGNRVYHDRTIDIDILFYGDRKLCTPQLVIPHPAVHDRPFIDELLLTLRPL
ncbi:MAG: 2-amino-4-hydroxy-6-hydroxymethyldihydropteridine diphosphokinase [Bacteroidales bacterium]|nr:2-amino-4-hydroxy-6-hydroxymethyldihydropteridine diphosphokinase [Bacteroidales bacterium]